MFLAHLYDGTGSYVCHSDVGIGVGFGVSVGVTLLRQSFLCYVQGTVRRAILYVDRSCLFYETNFLLCRPMKS